VDWPYKLIAIYEENYEVKIKPFYYKSSFALTKEFIGA